MVKEDRGGIRSEQEVDLIPIPYIYPTLKLKKIINELVPLK